MLHPLLQELFRRMNEAGIRWCLLRWPSQPDAPTGDIDLLVFREHARSWRAVARRLGFVRLPAPSGGKEWVHIAYDQPSCQWLRLHMVTEVFFGPHQTMTTDAAVPCLARREQRDEVYVLADEDMFWTTLLHCLLDKRVITERHRKRLHQLMTSVEGKSPLYAELVAACPQEMEAILERMQTHQWNSVEASGPRLLATWRRRRPLHRRAASFGRSLCHGALRIYYRLQRRGLSIALLGPDGAGKSTLAKSIEKRFFLPVRLIYMGSGEGGGNPWLARLRVPGLGRPGRLLLLWARFLRSQWDKAVGRLVVFDRYTYDAYLPQGKGVTWPYRLTRWLHARACPSPDLVLILDAPGTVMYERKREQDPVGLENQRQYYLQLQQWLPRVQVVDATQTLDQVQAEVLSRIWNLYASRWQRRTTRRPFETSRGV